MQAQCSLDQCPRRIAIGAYRGFVMLLVLAEVPRLSEIAPHFPHSVLWHMLRITRRSASSPRQPPCCWGC